METSSLSHSSSLARRGPSSKTNIHAKITPTHQPKITINFPPTKTKPFEPNYGYRPKPQAGPANESQPTLLATILNALDDLICIHLDPKPLHPSIDPNRVLSGHSVPVDELPPTPCPIIEGTLPPSLDGVYLRNGPNPLFARPNEKGPTRPHHLLEGDGMVHAIRISHAGTRATFCCRYIRTRKYEYERRAQYPFVPGILSSFNGSVAASVARIALAVARSAAGQFDLAGHGPSNVSFSVMGGRLLALCESDLPYEIEICEDGDVVTLGQHDLDASDPDFQRMTAHPKVDRITGEGFGYEYGFRKPFLTFFRTDGQGRKQKGVPIFSVKECVAVHDFGLTESYAVFPDGQMVVRMAEVWRGKSPMVVDGGKVQRLGIIGRYAGDDRGMMWVDTPGLNLMHCVNAWEEDGGDTVVVVGSHAADVQMFLEDFRRAGPRMERVTIDVGDRRVAAREVLSAERLELPVINPVYASRKNRYVYAAITDETSWAGVVKLDLALTGSDCTVARRLYGPGCSGGEPFFVPREPENPSADEDDGYLITYIHNEQKRESKFLVMDAKSPTLDIIAAVKLPQRVPDGFHGLFVPENHIGKV